MIPIPYKGSVFIKFPCPHAEGISYLVIVATVAYSLYVKVNTGKGLPAGPSGLLGAVEGLSYLALVGGLAAFGVSVGLRS